MRGSPANPETRGTRTKGRAGPSMAAECAWTMKAASLHILVVEDHADIRAGLGLGLDLLGHRAEFAVDVGSALLKAATTGFDVLLTDIGLPGRDGWALLAELGSRRRLPAVSITMSAGDAHVSSARSRAAGCRAHLVKPFSLEELEAALLPPG